MATFGELLKRYRTACHDTNGKSLTQMRLAELLSDETNLEFTPGAISEWERDKNPVARNRELVLVRLLKILHRYGGVKTTAQARDLLQAANYRWLNEGEQRVVFPELFNEAGALRLKTEDESPDSSEASASASGQYVVGRQSEVDRFKAMLYDSQRHRILNIYGPGGIGKTVVGKKMAAYSHHQEIPIAFIDGNQPSLTQERMLSAIKEGLANTPMFSDCFQRFEAEWEDNILVQDMLQRGGGVQVMFDVMGNIKAPSDFDALLNSRGNPVNESFRGKVSNRFALERYLRSVDRTLMSHLVSGLQTAIDKTSLPVAIVIDTYEEIEGYDDWVCRTLAPSLPKGVALVILGRNALPEVNFDWREFDSKLKVEPLGELSELEAKDYLRHYGLADAALLNRVYRFTGGYPLLLMLAQQLAQEVGGWEKIGILETDAERDRIATKLLERILREQRVQEVKEFLEKGAVARWFTPEIVGLILGLSPDEGRVIYDKLARHSFVERHPNGLKFHDKIRELLVARLKFNQPEHDRILRLLRDYYAGKSGIPIDEP